MALNKLIDVQWYKKFDSFMYRIGFKRCEVDYCCYVKSFDNSYIILLLYVDDMLIVGFDIEKINDLKKQLSKQFAMKDLGADIAHAVGVVSRFMSRLGKQH